MRTPTLVLIAITTLAACATLGGGLYEYRVVDPYWPKRPGIIQPRNGGVSRARFWIPAHIAFEVLLIITLALMRVRRCSWPWRAARHTLSARNR
jgi:hypothetical protein